MLSRFLERWYSTQDLTFFSLRGLSEIPSTLTVHPLKTQRTPTPRPHGILRTSTWFYFLLLRLTNSCMCFQTEDVTTADHFTGITGTSVGRTAYQNWTTFLHVRWNSIKIWLVEVLVGQLGPPLHVWLPLTLSLVGLRWGLPLTGQPLTSRQVSVGRMGQRSCRHTKGDSRGPVVDRGILMPFQKTFLLCNHTDKQAHSPNAQDLWIACTGITMISSKISIM